MSRLKKRYGNYPRKPMTSDSRPYIPKMNKAVLKEQTILNEKGDTEIIGNAPNVNYLKQKYYGV